MAARLRLSKQQRGRLACAAARTPQDGELPRALAYHEGMACARDRLLLTGARLNALDDWTPPAFPLKGGAIVARGIAAGPAVARIMRAVEARWIAEDFPNEARIEALLTQEVQEVEGQ